MLELPISSLNPCIYLKTMKICTIELASVADPDLHNLHHLGKPGPDPHKYQKPDPHPQNKKFDPDPHRSKNPGAAEDHNGAIVAHH